MPPNGKREQQEGLIDKLRSLFGSPEPQKKKDALPPKAHFSIWYFLKEVVQGEELRKMLGHNLEHGLPDIVEK